MGKPEIYFSLYNSAMNPITSIVGGTVKVATIIKVPNGYQILSPQEGLSIGIKEESTLHDPPAAERPFSFNLSVEWEKSEDFGTTWTSSELPTTANSSGTILLYRSIFNWDTTLLPLGHNGAHTINLVASNGDYQYRTVEYKKLADNSTYDIIPKALSTFVKNVVITGITASEGNIDYLKYDPSSTSKYCDPRVTVSFDDSEVGSYEYDGVLICWDTGGVSNNMIQNRSTDPLSLLADPNGDHGYAWRICGSLGSDIELKLVAGGDPLEEGMPPIGRGTYAYEIYLLKWDPATSSYVDAVTLKGPQRLSLTEENHGIIFGESTPIDEGINGSIMKVWYMLTSTTTDESDADQVMVVPLGDDLIERPFDGNETELGTSINTLYGGDNDNDGCKDGIKVYELHQQDEDDADWRVIFSAIDGRMALDRRDHTPGRMWATNRTWVDNGSFMFQIYIATNDGYWPDCDLDKLEAGVRSLVGPRSANIITANLDIIAANAPYLDEDGAFHMINNLPVGDIGNAIRNTTARTRCRVATVVAPVDGFITNSDTVAGLTIDSNEGGANRMLLLRDAPDGVHQRSLPDRIAVDPKIIEAGPGGRRPPNWNDKAAMTNAILHELGHAAGTGHCSNPGCNRYVVVDAVTDPCVMAGHLYDYFGIFGLAPGLYSVWGPVNSTMPPNPDVQHFRRHRYEAWEHIGIPHGAFRRAQGDRPLGDIRNPQGASW